MYCSKCGVKNSEEARVCVQCATPLRTHCPQCGFDNPSGFAFCGRCGIPLAAALSEPAAIAAERRHLTVMFCDQVDSVSRSQRLDPEELHEIVRQYQQMCTRVIQEFDGYVAQYQGDGLVVYFGYPVAHEDDAQRAVRAGLGILAALPHLNSRLQQTVKDIRNFPLHLRIGIHTGMTVVGEMGAGERRELTALGDTPNITSRLQGIAKTNAVVISATTYQLICGFFECVSLGPQELKGVSAPVLAYQVLDDSKVQNRFEAALTKGLTPMVGREQELELLLERWAQVKEGEGWVVMLSGEAGIGKSRLVQALKEHLGKEPHLKLEYHCSPYYQNSAQYPTIDLLQRLLRFERTDSPQEKFSKLETALERFHLSLIEIVPLLASFLSLPLPEQYPPLTLSPQRQRQKLEEVLRTLLVALTENQPVLQVVEDLHWADPSTLEGFSSFVNRGSIPRSLTLFTFRPEFNPPWVTRSHVTHLTLSRLSRKQIEEMAVQVTKGKTLPVEVLHQIVTKTDGIPLFVEELTKMVLESGLLREEMNRYALTGPFLSVGIPATLQDSLRARLDRLGPVKEVAQLAATVGREIPYDLLKAVSSSDETALQNALSQLVEAEVLSRKKLQSQELYVFKHALIQETAYQSLLKSTRQHSHKQIAQVLRERFPDIVETQPELLAHHYTEAGLVDQAIPYWQQASQRAIERSANMEAASHLNKGLELLKALRERFPDIVETQPELVQQELMLQTLLGSALMAIKGYADPEVERAYSRARTLCERIGETPQLFPVLFGLWLFYSVRAEHKTAHKLAEQLLSLAQSPRAPALLLEAHTALGNTLLFEGELAPARRHLEQGIALYDPHQHHSHAFLYGQDPGVVCRSYESFTLWLLGYPDQASRQSYEALALARELSHPFSQAFALNFVTNIHWFRREVHATREQADALCALSSEQGFPLPLGTGMILRGWALAERRQGDEGLKQIRQGLAVWRDTGAERFFWPCLLAPLAEVYGHRKEPEEGLTVVAEALAIVNTTRESFYEAELYRLKGELTLAQGSIQGLVSSLEKEVEECFWKAFEIARWQQAKSWELRAVMSLGRLWLRQGKRAEARRMLTEIYGWFTEGFDTGDLKEAKALLEDLS